MTSIAVDFDTPAARKYWFKCPNCHFEWTTSLQSSIIFVSLSFISDCCPNCRTKRVRAHKSASDLWEWN